MNLPNEVKQKNRHAKHISSKWIMVLCISTLIFSIASIGFCAYILSEMPKKIDSYVQAHKDGDKGDKGDTGPMGPRGFAGANGLNGTNSYAPTHCYSSDLFGGVTTNCY